MQRFAEAHPKDPRADDALYLAAVGELGQDEPARAAKLLEQVLQRYPAGDVVQQAMLKLAECRVRLKQPAEARALLARLMTTFPGTPAAIEAEARLARIPRTPLMRASFLMLCLAASVARAQAPTGGGVRGRGHRGQAASPRRARPGADRSARRARPRSTPSSRATRSGTSPASTSAARGTGRRSGPTTRRSPTPTGSTRATRCASFPATVRRRRPAPSRSTATRTRLRGRPVGRADGEDEVQMVRLPMESRPGRSSSATASPPRNEVEAAGTLVGSFAESEMLSPYDVVYLEFKDRSAVQVGASYVVFRTAAEGLSPAHRASSSATRPRSSAR